MENEIKGLLVELFDLIGMKVEIKVDSIASLQNDNEKDDDKESKSYKVEIDPGESAGLLIGSHGFTLSAIQSFLKIALKQKTGEWVMVTLDIAGWNEKQEERLIDLAKSTAERARSTGEEQRLYNLNAGQRRVVHMALKDEKDLETISEGEGIDRFLVVRLKK